MAKINDTTTFPNTAPALGDHVIGTDVSNVTNDAAGETVSFTWQAVMDLMEANMTVPSSVSAAYRTSTILSSTSNAEGAALIGVEDAGTYFAGATVEAVLAEIGALLPAEANADVTDTTNVTAAGALMDSEVTNLAQVKAFDSTDYAAASHTHTAGDIDAEASTDGYVLTSDGAGNAAWEAAAGGGASAIGDLTDVTITGAAQGDILYHNGTAWVDLTAGTSGQFLQTQGAAANPQWATPAGSGNVSNSGTPANNQFAVWTDSTTIEGISALTYDATDFEISADFIPNADGTVDLGSATYRYANLHVDSIDLNGSTLDGTTLADPGADRLAFWDDSEGTLAWLTAGSGLSISTTTITATPEGTAVLSTGEAGASKFLREDGDGTSSWQTVTLEGTAILSTGEAGGSKYLREDGDGTCSWQTIAGGGDVSKVGTPVDGQIGVWTGDGTIEGDAALTFDTTDDTLVIAASGKLGFGAVDILSDSAGTTTLQNIDALDATTEATIEAAIDTLANLTSVQGNTVTLTGDFIRSGAHSLTLTTVGATNVTLPTTGTLAAYGDTTANFTGTLQNGGSNVVVDTDIGSTVQAYDADTLKADTADQLTAGFTAATDDDSTASSPYTPDHDTGNYKRVINDGAMTINGPTMASGESTSMVILLTNTTGAGAITFGTTTDSGDTIGTTTTDEYLIFITAVDVGGTTYSHASVKALQ